MMKKLIVLMLAVVMVFGVCSCKGSKEEKEVKNEVEAISIKPEEAVEAVAKDADEVASEDEAAAEEKEPVQEETVEQAAPQKEEPVQEKAQEPAPAPEVKTASKETASKYIGQSASALVGAIGEPKSKTYASSCIGDGEDGEWYYDGFTVYTYRENGSERVEDVF